MLLPGLLLEVRRRKLAALLLLLPVGVLACLAVQYHESATLRRRHRPRLPWLTGKPTRRTVLTSDTPVPSSSTTCTHIADGPALAVDHRGFLCLREHISIDSGCCSSVHLGRYNCDGCELLPVGSGSGSGVCCLEFERCVSCCIGDAGADAAATVELVLTMEGCAARCRTASKSLDGAVWNRYKSEHKYCNGSGDSVDSDSAVDLVHVAT